MKLTNERLSEDTKFDIELTPAEHEILVNYAQDHMSQEEVDQMLIEWAVKDILIKQIEIEDAIDIQYS